MFLILDLKCFLLLVFTLPHVYRWQSSHQSSYNASPLYYWFKEIKFSCLLSKNWLSCLVLYHPFLHLLLYILFLNMHDYRWGLSINHLSNHGIQTIKHEEIWGNPSDYINYIYISQISVWISRVPSYFDFAMSLVTCMENDLPIWGAYLTLHTWVSILGKSHQRHIEVISWIAFGAVWNFQICKGKLRKLHQFTQSN